MANKEIKKLLDKSKKRLDADYEGFVKSIKDDLQSFKKTTLDQI